MLKANIVVLFTKQKVNNHNIKCCKISSIVLCQTNLGISNDATITYY